MASNRIGRINEEIQRELSALIPAVKDPRVSGMISVTAVETTPDLRYAKAYISVLDKENGERVLKGLRSASGWLRRELGSALKLRYTPELVWMTPSTREPTFWSCCAAWRGPRSKQRPGGQRRPGYE